MTFAYFCSDGWFNTPGAPGFVLEEGFHIEEVIGNGILNKNRYTPQN